MLSCRHQPITQSPSYKNHLASIEDEQVSEVAHLLRTTCGYFEKLKDGNPPRLGGWQVLCWQPRWYHAEKDAFCFQPISTTEKPTGKAERIPYLEIEEIEIRDSPSAPSAAEAVMHLSDGQAYAFKMSNWAEASNLVANLQKLCALAHGY